MLCALLPFASAVVSLTVFPTPGGVTVDIEGMVAQEKRCCGSISAHSCPGHVPDIPARVFAGAPDQRIRMIVGSTSYFQMSGPSPLNQTRSCSCSFNKTADGNPADFAGDEYLDSPVAFPNGTVVSLVHTEFPGNRFNESGGPDAPYCTGGRSYPNCWTVTVGLAVSHDWGASWAHALPPPRHLVAAVPYRYNQSQLASGWGDPSNILKHPTDGYYYAALWNRHRVGDQDAGICMMRTNDLLNPASWRAWDGASKAYSVRFANPYTLVPGTGAQHVCTVTNLPAGGVDSGCAAHGLFWSRYLRKFVVTLGCDQAGDNVFKFSTSDDLIQWSSAQVLLTMAQAKNITSFVRLGMNYPTFIDPSAPAFGDPNYGTIGQHPYLFWVSKGDNPEDIGRHLLATPFSFQENDVIQQ